MRSVPVCLAAIFLVGLAACDSPSPAASPAASAQASGAAQAPPATATPALASVDVGNEDVVDHVEVYTGGATESDVVPLVVAIHGLGDKPSAFAELFKGFRPRARFIFPAGGLPWGDGFAWWPIKGAIDEQNMAAGVEAARKRLMVAIRLLRVHASAGGTIVTGFSQGGMLSFGLAARYPKEIAEAVPVSGMLPSSLLPPAWAAGDPKPHIVALHGDGDARVPYELGKKSADALRALGLEVEWKSYPRIGHTITADMRSDLFEALQAAIERQTFGR